MVSREHLAVIRIGGGVARVGGVSVGSAAIVELWSRLWTGHGHRSRGGTSNRCRSGQGDSEQGGEDNNQLHKKKCYSSNYRVFFPSLYLLTYKLEHFDKESGIFLM